MSDPVAVIKRLSVAFSPRPGTGELRESVSLRRAEAFALIERIQALEIGLQNYMDACAYADKDTLVAAIGAAHKEAVRLLPRRVTPSGSAVQE